MTVESYLAFCAQEGIKRRQLADGFEGDGLTDTREPMYLSDDCARYRPPPLTEDLSHLNPSFSRPKSFQMSRWFKNLPPEEKAKKLAQMAAAGMLGGRATKGSRNRNQ